MSRSRRSRIETLEKRRDHLKSRIDEADERGYDLSYDKKEFNALEWAIPVLEGHVSANAVLHRQLKEEKDADR